MDVSQASGTISVLIVDDQPAQRAGFRMVLESQPDIVVTGECGDGAHALAHTRRNLTDVVLMDVRMPRVNGLVAAERIIHDPTVLSLGPAPRIVLVTALDLDDHIAAASDANAHAMLYKDVEPETLLQAIRSAAASRDVD
ncbi:MAG: response regulator [Microbacteriaceae bacterium]